MMPRTPPSDPREAQMWRKQNIIDYPHIVSQYMHLQNTSFRKEILENEMNVEDYWFRHE